MSKNPIRHTLLVFVSGLAVGFGAATALGPGADGARAAREPARASAPGGAARPPAVRGKAAGGGPPPEATPAGGPAEWLAGFNALGAPPDKERFLAELIEAEMRRRPQEVLAFLRALDASRLRGAAIERALGVYAEKSPEEAVKQAGLLLRGGERINALAGIAYAWGASDPPSAIAWIARQTDQKLAMPMLENMVSAAAQADPQNIRRLIEKDALLSGEQRGLAARALAGVWTQHAPQEAVEWAKGYSAQSGDARILATAYLNWATLDPAAAARALGTEDKAFSVGLAAELAGLWASQDPKSAAEWATSAAPEQQRGEALGNVADAWADSDPEAALEWASLLPRDDAGRAAALQGAALRWSLRGRDAFERKLAELPADLQEEIRGGLAAASGSRRPGGP